VTSLLVWLITPRPKEWLVWTAAGFQTFGIWKLTEHPVNGDPPTLHVWQFGPIFVILTSESWKFLWLTSCKGVLPLSECECSKKKIQQSAPNLFALWENAGGDVFVNSNHAVSSKISTKHWLFQRTVLFSIHFSDVLFTVVHSPMNFVS